MRLHSFTVIKQLFIRQHWLYLDIKRNVIPNVGNDNNQNYWVFGLLPSSGVLEPKNTTFQKLDLFPPSSEGGRHMFGWVSYIELPSRDRG
jgi:hypothetical protein